MSETRDARTDDAPASTAKTSHGRDQATDALIEVASNATHLAGLLKADTYPG
jgi:hypothetical protein